MVGVNFADLVFGKIVVDEILRLLGQLFEGDFCCAHRKSRKECHEAQ